jgi:hypothetical protein
VTTHVGLMVVFALFVSVVFATLLRDEPVEQVKLGAKMFAGMVGGAIAVGWLLYPLPL